MSKQRTQNNFFVNQKNTKYSERYISKQDLANQKKYQSTTKYTCTCKKRNRLFEKGLKKIVKMQNLSQNEFNQIAEMPGQSRDELSESQK